MAYPSNAEVRLLKTITLSLLVLACASFFLGNARLRGCSVCPGAQTQLELAASLVAQNSQQNLVSPHRDIHLLVPLDGGNGVLKPQSGIQMFFVYFDMAWPWVIGSASGVAVLQALYGGILIMLSGSDSGKRSEGKEKILWAIAGLLMIGFSGLILSILNPSFYVY